MKIAMYTDHFYPELGGIQDSVALTARSLGACGHQIDIFAPRHPAADFAKIGRTAEAPDLGHNVKVYRRLSLPFASSTQQSRAVIPLLTSLFAGVGRRRPDVIHSHSFFGLGLEALAIGHLLGVPVVGTNHTNVRGFGPYIPVSIEKAVGWVAWYYNRCAAITAPSRSVFEGLGAGRMRHVPHILSNPIDTEVFHPPGAASRPATRRSFGLTGAARDGKLIVYAGRLGREKNIDIVLRALAEPGCRATIAIAGHGAYEPQLRALAAGLGITQRVVFLGTLAPPRLAELFGAADLFTMMSTTETQSMATLQAMACGLPVIASAGGAVAEYIDSGAGRLVDPHDAGALAATIAELLADTGLCRRLGLAGRDVAQRHSVHNVTTAWEALYQGLLPKARFAWSKA